MLTYDRDRELVEPLTKETRLWVVRHADAGDRAKWTEPDHLRPLSDRGWKQAREIARIFGGAGIERLVSSPYVRCMQTLEPLAEKLRQPVEEVAELGEGSGLDGIEPLLTGGGAVAACTHGDVLDELLAEMQNEGLVRGDAKASKGSTWVLRAQAGLIQSAEYVRPPA